VWLALRMRRWLNLPMVVASGIVVALLIASVVAALYAASTIDDVRAGSYRATVAITAARSDGFDAKSAESLTLINRGSGQSYEDRFKAVAADAYTKLSSAGRSGASVDSNLRFAEYERVHQQIRELDDGGQWEKAVDLATSSDAQASNAKFAAFADASIRELGAQAASVDEDLSNARRPMAILVWVVLIGAVLAAAAAWRGIADRLREYR
jgi:hypothetical protein